MMTIDDLTQIAKRVVKEPWGVGHPVLEKNPESWAPYLRFLHAVVKHYKLNVCVELGVYMGTASAHMAWANPQAKVVGVDRDFHQAAWAVPRIFPNVEYIAGDTTDPDVVAEVVKALPFSNLNHERIDLLFIDSTHNGTTPRREFVSYYPYMASECLVVCDDLLGPEHLKVQMQDFWRWLPGEKQELHFLHPRLNDTYDEPGFGISILRRYR